MKNLLLFLFMCSFALSTAQENLNYQKPSSEILDLVDAPLAPSVQITDDGKNMLLLYRNQYKSIAELSEQELRLAGLRINPKTNIGSRTNYYNNIELKRIDKGSTTTVKGIPSNARLANFSWSPDQTKIAMTNTTENGVAVWVLDVATATMKQLTAANVNANMRDVINWFKDGDAILVKMLPEDRKPLINAADAVPTGPTISSNDGKKAQNRTYQDLLKNPNDEFNFEQLARASLFRVTMDGTKTEWLPADLYSSISFSPNGEYVMVVSINKPFSYLVTYSRFPSKTTIYNKDGKLVNTVLEVPLIEDLPQGFMATRTGMRNLSWRSDKPASLIYAKALDGGDPANEVDYRDEVFQVEAPFNTEGKSILKTINRFRYILWGNDNMAIAYDYWWNTRNTKTYLFNPTNNNQEVIILADRNYQDVYSDPGSFATKKSAYGTYTLALSGQNGFLLGDGYTKEGQFPFVDKINLETQKKTRLYTSKITGKKER